MILQTGGLAVGAIFTKSSSASIASFIASLDDMIPNCSPSSLIRRTSLSLICSLIIKSLIVVYLRQMNSFRFPMRNTKKRVNIISTRQSIKPFRKIRKEVLRYQTIVTRLCYGESVYSTLFFASRKDYTNTHTFLCQSLFFLTVINL